MAHARVFSPVHAEQLLKALGACRNTCTDLTRHMPITGEAGATYRANTAFLKALDDYVEVLTGNRTTFHTKLWSDPPKKAAPE